MKGEVSFRFYGQLNDLLPRHRRQVTYQHLVKSGQSVKDAIEAQGVPHPEVGLILANGNSVGFDYGIQPADRISVYPPTTQIDIKEVSRVQTPPQVPARFVLDGHLGRLATYLRLLGCDTLYKRDCDDDELARLAGEEKRILLTRDRGLLKRSQVNHGYLPRSDDPRQQLLEVAERYGLRDQMSPWGRCPRCNGIVEPVEKAVVEEQLPPHTRESYSVFHRCRASGQVYWKGAHHERIKVLIESLRHPNQRVSSAIGHGTNAPPARACG